MLNFCLARNIEADVKKIVAKDKGEVTLQNNLGNVSFRCFVSTPKNLDELGQVMGKAKREKLTVKAIGGFYAFSSVNIILPNSVNVSLIPLINNSPCCETTGYAIKCDKLVGTTRTPTTTFNDPSQEGFYDVLCGTSLRQVIETLEKDHRALMNLGGFTGT
jgi:hypothetical protein